MEKQDVVYLKLQSCFKFDTNDSMYIAPHATGRLFMW